MKHNLQLKVQAWVDGELPEREARRVAEWIARDAEASALADELSGVKQTLFHNETAAATGESREFYWSKIQSQIQREAGQVRREASPWFARWRRYLAPLAGAAALACILLVAVQQADTPTFDEVFSTIDGMEAMTFHDQASQMTVVWLQDKNPVAEEIKPAQPEGQGVPEVQDKGMPQSSMDM